MGLFKELIWRIMMQQEMIYPIDIHLPTGSFRKTILDNNIPVMAPSGESSKDNPRLPSVKCSLVFIDGIAATQVPNNKLETENKKPTERADLFFMKEEIFLIMIAVKNTILLH